MTLKHNEGLCAKFASSLLAFGFSFLLVIAALAEPSIRPAPVDALAFRAEVRLTGDAAFLKALEGGHGQARAYAIRASAELLEPALAIPALARISGAREPFDAEAALFAVSEIIHNLDEDFLARAELDEAPFAEAVEALAAIHGDALIPLSWRSRAGVAALELRSLIGR